MALRKKIAAGLLVAATMSVAAMLNQESGDLAPEKVVAEQPEVIIATGGSWAKDPKQPEVLPHVELGYKSTKDIAEKTLASLLKTPGFDALEAPKDSELHTVSRDDAHYGVLVRGHHQVELLQTLRVEVNEQGSVALVAIHDLNLAARYCDELVGLLDGEIVAQGKPAEVLSSELLEHVYGFRAKVLYDEGVPVISPVANP